jgi:hypothetical protein
MPSTDLSPDLSPGKLIEISLGLIFVVIYAFGRFNTPVDKDQSHLARLYAADGARTSTTALQFFAAFVCYLAILIFTYVMMIIDDRWQRALLPSDDFDSFRFSVPLLGALVLTVVLPRLGGVSQAERKLRHWLQRLGSIPTAVSDLVFTLRGHFDANPAPEEEAPVQEAKGGRNGRKPRHPKVMKARALWKGVQRWGRSSVFRGYMTRYDGVRAQLERRFAAIDTAFGDNQEPGPNLREKLDVLITDILEFVARGVLKSTLQERGRQRALKELGLDVEGVQVTLDHAALGLMILGGVTLLFFSVLGPYGDVGQIFFKATTISSYFFVSAAVPIVIRQRQGGSVPDGAGRSYSRYFLSGTIAAALCGVLSFAFKLVRHHRVDFAWDAFRASYPWLILSFVIALGTAFVLDNDGHARPATKRLRILECLGCASWTAGWGFLVVMLVEKAYEPVVPVVTFDIGTSPPRLMVVALCTVIGGAIGYFVPSWSRPRATSPSAPSPGAGEPSPPQRLGCRETEGRPTSSMARLPGSHS